MSTRLRAAGLLLSGIAAAACGCSKYYVMEGGPVRAEGRKLLRWQPERWGGVAVGRNGKKEILANKRLDARVERIDVPVFHMDAAVYERIEGRATLRSPCAAGGLQSLAYLAAVVALPVTVVWVAVDGGLPNFYYDYRGERRLEGEVVVVEDVELPGDQTERRRRPAVTVHMICDCYRISGDRAVYLELDERGPLITDEKGSASLIMGPIARQVPPGEGLRVFLTPDEIGRPASVEFTPEEVDRLR